MEFFKDGTKRKCTPLHLPSGVLSALAYQARKANIVASSVESFEIQIRHNVSRSDIAKPNMKVIARIWMNKTS